VIRLGDLCKTAAGGTPLKSSKEFYEGGAIPWLVSGEVNNRNITSTKRFITQLGLNGSSAKVFPANTVVIAMYGATAGEVGILKFPTSTNQAVCGIYPNEKVLPEYLYYFFLSHKSALVAQAVGNAQPNISQQKIKDTYIDVPPIPEQQRIVAILDQAFADIEKARANAEKNLKNARELFDSYLNQVFSQRGEGWVEKSLGEIADVEYGYTDKSTEEGDFRYIRITDIDKNGELISENKKYIRYTQEAKKFIALDKDLLMARTGATFAKLLLYRDYEPSVFASYLIRINFKEDIDNELYWHFSKTQSYWSQADELKSGAAQPHFNGAALKQVRFPYPQSREEQTTLIQAFNALSIETQRLEVIFEQKLVALDELKKSLLQKAFSGELTKTEDMVA
jgi:type I restriction enzyme, S subunit